MQKGNTQAGGGRARPETSTPYGRSLRGALTILACSFLLAPAAWAGTGAIRGKVLDPQGAAVAEVKIELVNAGGTKVAETTSDAEGNFSLSDVDPGVYQLRAESPSFVAVVLGLSVASGQQQEIPVQFAQIVAVQQQVTVVESAPALLTPDPAQTIFIHDQVLDANPGRPGAPISIPGLPVETASGGIKAPQYFAPGVAGDHGEPIAQYFQ